MRNDNRIELQIVTLAMAITFGLAIAPFAQAQTFHVIYSFAGHGTSANPIAGVTLDQHGDLFGTSSWGGQFGGGTVYELKHTGGGWVYQDLHDLGGGEDGFFPWAGVTIGPNGTLYGNTYSGGTLGHGIIFNLRPPATVCRSVTCPWDETVLYNFMREDDGGDPQGGIVFDANGNLYGAVVNGGLYSSGVVYKMSPSNGGWTYQVLYPFTGGQDGANPDSLLLFDSAGNMYGSALSGGAPGCQGFGCGTIFKLSPSGSGWVEQTLYAFTNGTDGADPQSGVVADGAGNLYGATPGSDGALGGTVFELSRATGSWTFNLMADLSGQLGPWNTLVRDRAGNVYGATVEDGAYGQGNIFKLTPTSNGWVYTSLHDFTGGADGGSPEGGLVMDSNGNIYGTTAGGGQQSCECGVVFEITP